MRKVYYNEFDPFAAEWLRNLIKAGHIAQGDVDDRSIKEVSPVDLIGYDQCHFFAGIGVWSYALRLAGWPDDRPVWTGSCPCQPFSAAGKRGGTADERHLWPAFYRLIDQCRPRVVFGEQVASKDGLAWLDIVHADLEAAGYAVGALDICAAGVGAPHIRQRLFFVADADDARPQGRSLPGATGSRDGAGELAARETSFADGFVGNANQRGRIEVETVSRCPAAGGRVSSASGGFWSDCDWLPCIDGKARPVEPGTFPLVDGSAFKLGSGQPLEGKSRVGMLRAYGNAIVAPAAEAFIRAYMQCRL